MRKSRIFWGLWGLQSLIALGIAVVSKQDSAAAGTDAAPTHLVAMGRQVYIAEGCIHCHSQYVRSVGHDRELWGPESRIETALRGEPVLIGNRRQGPDLSNIALRRPPAWNRLHLLDPRAVVAGSRMPAYPHLFADGDTRGEALLAYLASLGVGE